MISRYDLVMRKMQGILAVLGQAILLVGVLVAVRAEWLPRGVPGEWEWLKLPPALAASAIDLVLASFGIALYAGFAAWGMMSLGRGDGVRREGIWLIGLSLGAVGVQFAAMSGAPYGYGLTKWPFALYQPGSSGYYTVARQQVQDLPTFLSNYPDWIQKQDALHVGTHPPGLFVTSSLALKAMQGRPDLAKRVVSVLPESVIAGFRELGRKDPLPAADQASIALTGLVILLACALTVVPLYLLARATLPAPVAWATASLWPLVPSAILFQPTADTAFPWLSTAAIALEAWSSRKDSLILAAGAGVVLGIGMFFTLAYLPVGLVVALVLVGRSTWRGRVLGVLATGAGFVGFTLFWGLLSQVNPLSIWWTNLGNHARFYVEYPRSYLAWVLANPIETAIGIGVPTAVWAIVGFLTDRRAVPRSTWATLLVLVILNFSGRNLSEVARLWLPLMPPLLAAAGVGMSKLGGPGILAATLMLIGGETLILQTTVQVVYPF